MYPNIGDKDKFVKISNRASTSLKLFLIDNEIKDLAALKKKLEEMEKQVVNVDKIIDVCMTQKGFYQDEELYLKEMCEELLGLGASEKAVIKICAHNMWPRAPRQIKEELMKSSTVKELRAEDWKIRKTLKNLLITVKMKVIILVNSSKGYFWSMLDYSYK